MDGAGDVPLARVAGGAERPVVLLEGADVDHRQLAEPAASSSIAISLTPAPRTRSSPVSGHLRVELLGRRRSSRLDGRQRELMTALGRLASRLACRTLTGSRIALSR